MSKTLSKQDKIKKLQTNIKSAQSTFALAGILALIYVVRYFVTGNFNFYFSSYITEFALKAADSNIPSAVSLSSSGAYCILAVYAIIFIVCCVFSLKAKHGLLACLIFYIVDFAALIYGAVMAPFGVVGEEIFIDIIVHIFVILFLSVGVYSVKKLPEVEKE
ncbi:MAG: hypothetical protein IJB93_06185 [Clostridia bacterium]|nr:hypothetical protein [Clostridia bacterium]